MNGDAPDRLRLYLSLPSECGYLPGRQACNLFADPDAEMRPEIYASLLRQGFRRSGRLVYRPRCDDCRQCLSVRVPVARFDMRRRFRRVLAANRGLSVSMRPAAFRQEHFDLYARYTASRHPDGSMQHSTPAEYADFLIADWCDTHFLEIREKERLLAVAATDQLDHGLSAVYTFFEPDLPKRSLGIYSILAQLGLARQLGLSFLYLGYWIRDCRRMSYKAEFRPLQVFSQGQWREFGVGDTIDIPELAGEQSP